MRTVLLALAMSALAIAHAQAQTQAQPDVCEVPEYLTHVEGKFARVPTAVRKDHRLLVLVIGTGSSSLAGPEGARSAYPARLEAALASRLPQASVKVVTDVKGRRTAAEMAAAVAQLVRDEKPDLVIWQTGTVDAMRGVDPDEFRATLEKGVATARAAGADVVLMNMQYSPRTETMIADQAYADAMHSVAQQQDVPLFDRFSVMRHWSETGTFDLSGCDRSRIAEKVHDCLGKLLAELIVDTAQLDRNSSKDNR